MGNKYSAEEDKKLNAELKKLQNRAKKLILNDYYESITISDIDYSILTQITNAESHYDVSAYLWNTGMMERTLDIITEKIKQARKER